MIVSVTTTGHALSARLQRIATDRIGLALAPVTAGHARVVLAWPRRTGLVHAHVSVALAGRTVEVDGAATAAEYALVNAALALRRHVGETAPSRAHAPTCATTSYRPSAQPLNSS